MQGDGLLHWVPFVPPGGRDDKLPLCRPRVALLRRHLEFGVLSVGGAGADHDVEDAGLDDPFHALVINRERVGLELEFDGGFLAGLEREAVEAAQRHNGLSDGGELLVDVEFSDLVALAAPGVGDVDADGGCVARLHLRGRDAKVIEAKCGVAEAVAEGEERRAVDEGVAAVARRLVIVIVGKLPDGAREGDGQFAAGINVAEEDVGRSGAAFPAEIPAFENGGNVGSNPVDGERAAVDEEDYGRRTGVEYGFDELALGTNKIQRRAVAEVLFTPGFAGGGFVAANDDDGDVGFARDRSSRANVILLRTRIDDLHVVLIPTSPAWNAVGDFAALRVQHVDSAGGEAFANAIEDADGMAGLAAVATEVRIRGVRTDNSYGL